MADMEQGMYVHGWIVKDAIGEEDDDDAFIAAALMHMYSRCGYLQEAEHLFGRASRHSTHSWTVLISAYGRCGRFEDAVRVFFRMQQCGEAADHATIVSLLGAFTAASQSKGLAKQMHSRVVGSAEMVAEKSIAVGNALITMYGKLRDVEEASEAFCWLPKKDTVSWTAMIGIYAQDRRSEDAIQLFQRMLLEGVQANRVTYVNAISSCAHPKLRKKAKSLHARIEPCTQLRSDVTVGNTLVNAYAKACDTVADARRVFERMPVRDEVSWTTMITGYVQHGLGNRGIEHFRKMYWAGIEPNSITFVTALSACAHEASLVRGRLIHHHCVVCHRLHVDTAIQDALIHMYGHCSSLDDARSLFDKMSRRNTCTWATLIGAYAHNGLGSEVIALYGRMKGEYLKHDEISFLNMLSACSHAGLVDEGHHIFASMRVDHGIEPSIDHYHCMIDMYGRMGRLAEAKDMIHEMPHGPTAVAWMTLLGSCRNFVNHVDYAEYAADCVFRLEPLNPKPYVALANIYAAIGRGNDAEAIMSRMKEKCPTLDTS
jgi:pentatricopeptide repeat protein